MGEALGHMFLWALNGLLNSGGCSKDDLKIDTNMLTFSNWLWGYLMIIGLGFTLVYFLFEMNQKLALEGHDLNIKSIMAPILKLAIACILLMNGASIVGNILGFHNNFVDKASDYSVGNFRLDSAGTSVGEETDTGNEGTESMDEETAKEQIMTAINGFGVLQLVGLLPFVLIMAIIQMVLSIIWKYKALVYKLELLWKIGITPIALSDIYNGSHSNAIRWIKSLLAMALYGASFILIVKLGNSMVLGSYADVARDLSNGEVSISLVLTAVKNILSFVVIPFAELGVLSAIRQATKEALG